MNPTRARSLRGSSPHKDLSITIYDPTDIEAIKPTLLDFQSLNPHITITYHELQTLELYKRVLEETRDGGKTADLVISSAMDLQMKLANDGFARRFEPSEGAFLPRWANWRNEAFGITFEAAVIAYNRDYFKDRELPRSHTGLLDHLNRRTEEFSGRIATYDVRKSGVGFLFLARDIEHYSAAWELVHAMSRADVQLYKSTSTVLKEIASGRILLGYNLLGSYAGSMAAENPEIGVILPEDYTVALSRIGLIPKAARAPEAGEMLLDYLLSERGQTILATKSKLNAVHSEVRGRYTAATLRQQIGHSLRPVKVGPSLLVYLDQLKRQRILDRWEQALKTR